MALPNPLEAFIWGQGGAQLTPEQVARQRQIAVSLMGKPDFSPAKGGWLEVLGRGLQGAAGGYMEGKADRADAANTATDQSLMAQISSSLTGGGAQFPAAPSPAGDMMSSTEAPSPVATTAGAGGPLADQIRTTAEALGIDPIDLGTAISYETAGTFDPMKKGPTTQWGQHRGLIQFGEPQAQKYGVNWDDPIGSQLGPDGAVAKYLRDTGVKPGMGMLDIYSAINAGGVGRYGASDANNGGAPGTVADKVNNQMAGHRAKALALLGSQQPPTASSALDAMAAPTQVASLDQSIGIPEQQVAGINLGPESGLPTPMDSQPIAPVNSQEIDPSSRMLDPSLMGTGQMLTGSDASGQMVTGEVVEPSQRVAQALQEPEMAGRSQVPTINPAILEALSNPAASEQTKRIAGMLLGQQMEAQQQANDPMRKLDMEYKQAQIGALGRKGDGNEETFFGNPVAIQGPDGNISYGQMGNRGSFRPIQLPEGQSFAPPTKTIDTGTETIMVDQAGNVISRTPKQNYQEALDRGAGAADAKVKSDTNAELSSITSKMPGLYSVVDQLQDLAGKATYTGAGQLLDYGIKELGMEPREAAVARAEYSAIVDNQILPLLRDTFGAQFTETEGERLARTLGDPDKSPTEKSALLRAFIQQKERDIQGLETRVGGAAAEPAAPKSGAKRLKFNPATGDFE